MHKKLMAAAVGSAVAAATLGKTELRELTVTVTIKARVADDSPLAPLVVEALQELIARNPDRPDFDFESKAGLDVSCRSRNEYVEVTH